MAQQTQTLTPEAVIERDQSLVTPAIYRYTNIVFERGEGVYLYDITGRRYLDFVAGIATMNVGHSHPRVVAAVQEQAAKLMHPASHVGYYLPYVELLEALRDVMPGSLRDGKAVLLNSGSEAVEAALKLARYVTGRPMVIAFMNSFHGRPMGALSLTSSSSAYRRHLSALLPGVYHVPYPNPFRPDVPVDSPEALADVVLGLIEKALETIIPPEELAAIVVEPIAGEGGYIVPPDNFLPGLRAICDRTGALLIADEVQTGIGRTGKMFAVEHWNVEPDIISLGKAIGGGLPLSAVWARREIMDAWPAGAHGTTFGGNPVACRAGLESLRVLQEENLVDNAARVGDHIQARFRDAQEEIPLIGDVRGKGLMVGVELVTPDGSPAKDLIKPIIKEIGDAGVVMTKCGASTLRIAPPLIITQEQADEGVDIILDILRRHTWK